MSQDKQFCFQVPDFQNMVIARIWAKKPKFWNPLLKKH